MARRAGKAANRRARQRNVQRPATRPAATAPANPAPAVESAAVPETVVREDRPARTPAPAALGTGSTLTLRERAEYHYVERDLRNIGILSAIMAAMLLAAWFAFNALGLI
jgi:hypothetical protein